MKRYRIFIATYVISTLVYLFIRGQSWADGLYFMVYLLSSLFFVFELGQLPKKDILKYPEVFKFRAKRLNIYSYIVLAALAFESILYSILLTTLKISGGVSIIVLWPVLIAFIYLASLIHAKVDEKNDLLDFIFNDKDIDDETARQLLNDFTNNIKDIPTLQQKYPALGYTTLHESLNRYDNWLYSRDDLNYSELKQSKKN